MKRSGKILIVVLCLIILGLTTFIVVDKIINNKKDNENTNTTNVTQNNVVTNSNENVNSANNTNTNNQNENNDETKVANEAIRNALKDKKWLENNIYPEYYFEDNDIKKFMEVYFSKIHSINVNPAYIVDVTESMAGSHYARIVTYKDGKVFVSKNPATGECSTLTADLNRNIIAIENDPTGTTSVYKIENGEFVEFARADLNYEDDTLYYYVNDENVSYGRYKTYIEDCVGIETKLTDDNIDKYVK